MTKKFDIEYVPEQRTYLIRRDGDVVAQLAWSPEPVSPEDHPGNGWVFTPAIGDEEEWSDLPKSGDADAVQRAIQTLEAGS